MQPLLPTLGSLHQINHLQALPRAETHIGTIAHITASHITADGRLCNLPAAQQSVQVEHGLSTLRCPHGDPHLRPARSKPSNIQRPLWAMLSTLVAPGQRLRLTGFPMLDHCHSGRQTITNTASSNFVVQTAESSAHGETPNVRARNQDVPLLQCHTSLAYFAPPVNKNAVQIRRYVQIS
jgi:hypothetical protein